jgi:uncharacterized membrane protein YfcA
MDAASMLLLAGAGLAGGTVTAMVGGASLITFPALLAAGLPPVIAAASNTVAMTPSNFVAAAADYKRLPGWKPAFHRITIISLVGSAIGAWLLLSTPERAFMAMVPLLIGVATLLFAFSRQIRRWTFRHGDDPAIHSARADRIGLMLLAPVAVYVGYFGAGAGIMLMAILSLGHTGDFRTVNALKNLIGGFMSVVAIGIFIFTGMVAWPQALAMGVGAVCGGFLGERLVRVVPGPVVRWVVIVVGCAVTATYGYRYWFAT